MNREIQGEQYFYPQIEYIVKKKIESDIESKVILIIGQPGSGKSVFMSQLFDKLKNKIEFLTAIKAEFLNKSDSPTSVYKLFDNIKTINKPKVLLLDSLDVLAYSRRIELQEWLFYVDKLKNIDWMTIICASRSFEAEHLFPMNEHEWSEKVKIDLLPQNFIIKILDKLHYDYSSLSSNFKEFLRIPLHLKIGADIINSGGDPKGICSLHGLYAKLLELLKLSPQEMNVLSKLAEQMIKNRTICLSFPLYNIQLLDSIRATERAGISGIIEVDDVNQKINFNHQTFIDYFSAWKIIHKGKSLRQFVLEHNQSLFIRPVIRHILGFLRINAKKRLFKELNDIFFEKKPEGEAGFVEKNGNIRMHIKTAIIANIASWENPSSREANFLIRIFREAQDRDTLIIQFFNSRPNPDWYDGLKDKYILLLIKNKNDSNIEYRIALSFLSNIAKYKQSEILDISLFLLSQKKNRAIESFIDTVSEQLSQIDLDENLRGKYVELLDKSLDYPFIDRSYYLVITLKRIAKYFPERALNLYFNSVKKEIKVNKKRSTSRDSLSNSFKEVLQPIYEEIPYEVLLSSIIFFDEILSSRLSNKKILIDSASMLLFSKMDFRYGLDALYHWYKLRVLEFSENLTDEAKNIIKILQHSKWETQRQLAMLCKIGNKAYFKEDILAYIKDTLKKDLKDPSVNLQSELFIRALENIFDIVSSNEKKGIINSILKLDIIDESQAYTWIWKTLHHIPGDLRDSCIKEKMKAIQKKFNFGEYKYSPPIRFIGFQRVKSPISSEELKKMGAEELFKFLINNRALKIREDYDRDNIYGGVRELAKEVASVLAEDLKKYKDIIIKLSKDTLNNVYIEWFFISLSQKGVDKENLDWIIDLTCSVYRREELQLEIVSVLRKTAENISLSQFDKIKNLLLDLSEAKDPEQDKFFEYRKKGYANDALTEGINSTRGALVELITVLLSKFTDDILFDILEKLSSDKTISVRAALVYCLPYALKDLRWKKCFKLFLNTFNKNAEEYDEIVSHFLQYCPNTEFGRLKEILDVMKDNRAGNLGKPYALINTIFYFRGLRSSEELMEILTDRQLINKAKEESFIVLANQVKYKETIEKALVIINRLLDTEDKFIGDFSIVFMEANPEDVEKISKIIKKVVRNPNIRSMLIYHILEYLEKSILTDPPLAFDLLEEIISVADEDFYNLRDYIPASHSKAPLNIINTIFECYPEEEDRALESLDKLIKLKWSGVDEYLYALDRL